ncbi:MAG: hypothetical protein M1338_04855 [Patescibacteria group bacterium]|nr:hypothetical protein [Patescibacteria group bacterium]
MQQWYIIGTAILGALLNNPKLDVDPKISIYGLSKKEFDTFMSLTSSNLDNLTEIIKKDVGFDDQFVYSFNPLEYYPLVKISKYYYCPLTTFLVWRVTSGIYFDLVNDKNFGHPFGLAFQDYLEEISRVVMDNKNVEVIPEEKYKTDKGEKDSVDLILFQKEAALFIEAKTKRLSVKSKSEFISDETLDKDLDILAMDIAQTYSTINDYLKGSYLHLSYSKDIKIYPLIVTLEDWFLFGEDAKNLRAKVIKKLLEKGIPENYLKEMPYSVCSSLYFEYLIQIINNHSISQIMDLWFTPDKIDNNFGQFLTTQYRGEYKNIDEYFPGDFEKIYPRH